MKNKKFIILLVSMFILMNIVIISFATEIKEGGETVIDVSNGWIFADESTGEFTSFSAYANSWSNQSQDVPLYQSGYNFYTTDSQDYKDQPSVQPGKTVATGNVAPNNSQPKIPTDSDGDGTNDGYKSLSEVYVYFYPYESPTTRTEAQQVYQQLADEIGDTINEEYFQNVPNLTIADTAEANGEPIIGKIIYDENGNEYIYYPENFNAGEYFIGGLALYDEFGEMIDWQVFSAENRLFVDTTDGDKELGDEDEEEEDDPNPSDSYRYVDVNDSTIPYRHLTPSRNGTISNSIYDVSTAIPTSENLDFNVTADDSLYDISVRKYNAVAGINGVKVKIKAKYYYDCNCSVYEKKWDSSKGKYVWKKVSGVVKHPGKKHVDSISYTAIASHEDEIRKTYYDVPISNIYPVNTATITGAPVDGAVTVGLTGGPTVGPDTISVTGKLPNIKKTHTYTIPGIYSNKTAAKNDYKSDGHVVAAKDSIRGILYKAITQTGSTNYSYRGLQVTTTSSNGVPPVVVKTSGSTTKMIPSTKSNGNYETSGTVKYGNGQSYGFDPNDVFVHTPVVNNSKIINISKFINQKVTKDSTRTYLMLDEQFTVKIPDDGTHIDVKGYKNRGYNSKQAVPKENTNWGKIKDVKFSFDVYLHNSNNTRTLIKADTWLSDEKYKKATAANAYTFTIPVWAQEGNGTITTRVIAENAKSDDGTYNDVSSQDGANLDWNNYIATKTLNVEVIGKIYDLRISSTNDPGWQNINGKNGDYITAGEFPFGQKGQNKVTAYKYAPKLGYVIAFDFKTKGIKSNNVDVSIQPEGFYFVSKTGGSAKKVDLYYSTTTQKYVKINPADTKIPVITNLTYPYMKVSKTELNDSVIIMNSYLKRNYIYSQNVNIGYFSKLSMPEKLRLCYNNFLEYIGTKGLYKKTQSEIATDAVNGHLYSEPWNGLTNDGKNTVIGSVGHWYAGYRLPSSTVAVDPGTTREQILNNNSLIKKDGYILVRFKIRTKYNEFDYLEYLGPESINESIGDNTGEFVKDGEVNLKWPDGAKTPPVTQEIILPNDKPANVPVGTVAIFETDHRATSDFESVGTH